MADASEPKHVNDRSPNWYGEGEYEGHFYLLRCFACEPKRGKENWAPGVATGCCSWCGWSDPNAPTEEDDD